MIEPAQPTDLPALAALMATSPLLQRYRVSYEGAVRGLQDALAAGDTLVCSRTASGPIAGFAWVSFAPRVLNSAAYLRLLLVSEPGHGTGSTLLAAVEKQARARSNHLFLLATADNEGARRFYTRHGYRQVGDLPGLVWPNLDEALYHKRLRNYDERLP